MIRIKSLNKYYGSRDRIIRAADNISLDVASGQFAVITGPSGSGKSTLLNLIGGMTAPNDGAITVYGRDILSMSDKELSRFRAHTIGYVFQFQSMISTLSAIENVRLPLLFTGQKDKNNFAESLLEKVGLKDRMHAYAHELSAGQKRRVGIARALINTPPLLLCDEPTSDLDPKTETIIMNMISDSNKTGTTVLMTTHNPALRSYASMLYVMDNGCTYEV